MKAFYTKANPERMDRVLVDMGAAQSRAHARRLCDEGLVRLDGRVARKSALVESGNEIVVDERPREESIEAKRCLEPFTVVYEDDAVVVVDKAAGVPCHPIRSTDDGTLAQALEKRYPEMKGIGYGPAQAGLVHRLDNDTSGLLLAARSRPIFTALVEAMRSGSMQKGYLALCHGTVAAPQDVTWPLATHPKNRRKVLACTHPNDARRLRAKPALTRIVSVSPHGTYSLVSLKVSLAGRHQIRAHFAALGRPLVGDELYGGERVAGLGRHFLHASSLRFFHPLDRRIVDVSAPLPEGLGRALDTLECDD